MAGCIEISTDSKPNWIKYKNNLEEQNDEIAALNSFYENTDNIQILDDPLSDTTQKYSLQISVPIQTRVKPIKVQLWLPIERSNLLDNDVVEYKNIQSKDLKRPSLQRSISGKRAHTTIDCEHLTPLMIDITLPDNYPSESGPYFKLSSDWLNKNQLAQLYLKLNEIWNENFNMPVLYTWIEWLKENLIEYLDVFEEPNLIIVTPLNEDPSDEYGQRTLCLFENSESFLYEFLRHNHVEQLKLFNNSIQNCMICFDEKMGREFFRLDNCKHHFCLECMTSMCAMHVKDGTIELLKCPDKDCKEVVPISVISQVLDEEEFERWERLLFQHTLDVMEDVIYCPKCTNPIIIDDEDTHAYCMICKIDYCKLCKDTWHTQACRSAKTKLEDKVRNLKINLKDLVNLTDKQIRAQFNNASHVIDLKKKSLAVIEKTQNEDFMKNYLSCPKCKAPVEKNGGCNKMTCKCGASFCYICGKKIDSYDHFQANNCSLWTEETRVRAVLERPEHENQKAIKRVLELMPDQKKNIMKCPTCGQNQLKIENNNHIKCWLCKTNMCFYCKKKIDQVSVHYRPGNCKQHS